MVQIQLLCIGKLKERFFLDACQEYIKRLGAQCKMTLLELPEQRLPEQPSPAQIEAALCQEADTLRQKIPRASKLIALCVEGDLLSSEQLSARLDRWMLEGCSSLCLLIGGSHGLHADLKQQATLRLSMSPMTFPHHLARVMVLEQLYRCFQISAGTRYHK